MMIRWVLDKLLYKTVGFLRWLVDSLGCVIFGIIYAFTERKCLPPIENPILLLSASQLMEKLKSRECTCREVVETYISRLRAVNVIINAVAHNRYNEALEEADAIDLTISNLVEEYNNVTDDPTDRPYSTVEDAINQLWIDKPLLGLPVSIKEAFAVEGCPNSSGLATRSGVLATENAAMVIRLRYAGCILLCVTNVSELCMWWESANHVYGRTNNPYDSRRIVGGSSGGEAAVLAAAGSVCGLGSDIGGSIRMPAHFNGIFGHKATTKSLPNDGQYPIAEGQALEFMLPGPMCRYGSDLRLIMNVLAVSAMRQKLRLDIQIKDIRDIGFFYMTSINDHVFTSPVEKDIQDRLLAVVETLKSMGCHVEPVGNRLKLMKKALPLWSAKMVTSGTTPFHILLADGHPEGFHSRKRIWDWLCGRSKHTLPALGLAVLEQILALGSEANERLCKEVDVLRDDLQNLLQAHHLEESQNERFDNLVPTSIEQIESTSRPRHRVLLIPTNPTTAPYHHQPLFRCLNFAYTGVFNVLGFPVTNVPIGLDHRGLPIGIQVVGDMHHDYVTLSVAEQFETIFGGWIQP